MQCLPPNGAVSSIGHLLCFAMKRHFITLFLCSCSLAMLGQTLHRGTNVPVKSVNTITSKHGSNAAFAVSADVKAPDGTVVIRRGTLVEAKVTAVRARGCGRPGSLRARFLSVQAVDGQTIALDGIDLEAEGRNKRGLAIGLGVGLSVPTLCLPLLGLLAIKGGQAVIEEGTSVRGIQVAEDFTLAK